MKTFPAISICLLVCVFSAEALKCYECSDEKNNPACDKKTEKTCSGTGDFVCLKAYYRNGDKKIHTKSCVSKPDFDKTCASLKPNDKDLCLCENCEKDLCNGSSGLLLGHVSALLALLAAALVLKLI